ncbi:MAG TPA: Txe/YoeB family addiction module toxin [archaeon]|nr:Txe/YoeB family addiction module toxin [archaeon]
MTVKGRVCVFQPEFIEDLEYWVKNDRKTALKVLELVNDVLRTPIKGKGKPEKLKYLGPDVRSRRITQEHRLVYMIRDKQIDFLQCRYHY